MTLLLSDPRVSAVPVRDVDKPLVALDPGFGPGKALVRRELATLLESARAALPSGIYLRVVEGYRPAHRQQAIIERYSAEIRAVRPGIGESALHILTSRHVAPLAVAPRWRCSRRRPLRSTWVLSPNVRTIKSRTAGELMAVVKADGFGHGQIDVARAALAGGATRAVPGSPGSTSFSPRRGRSSTR
jgi:hypothetical protein